MRSKKIATSKEEEAKNLVIAGIVNGTSKEDIFLLVKEKINNEEEKYNLLYRQALSSIRDRVMTDIDKIIPQHIELYEEIYKEFDEKNYVPGKLKALRQKERLIGLHKETGYVEVHNEVNIEVNEEPAYDVAKLNTKEQKRLSELMKRISNGDRKAIRVGT